MKERYECNEGTITRAEQDLLITKRAVIAGCGGLGCYAAEFLARIGLGHLSIIDGDVFTVSNLNRQLYSLETNLGKSKAAEAKERLLRIRSDLSIEVFTVFINEDNAEELLKGHDIIIDALDTVKTRLLVERTADALGIPLVHGAVNGWTAQVCTVFPGDYTLSKLYPADSKTSRSSVISFTPAFCASLQTSEAVKVLLNKENILKRKLIITNLLEKSFDIVNIS